MSIDPSNVNNLPKMPKNVAPKNPDKPQNMPQPEGSIMKNLPKPEGQTGFKAVIQPEGEVTVEDKKSQQAHANANKARLNEVAIMKAAAQGAIVGAAAGIAAEYLTDIGQATGIVQVEHIHTDYENGKKVGERIEYSGSTDYSRTATDTATGTVGYSQDYSGAKEYTGKTADGVEYSGSTDYSGTVTGTVTGTAGYTGKTADGVEYSGTVEYSVGEQKKPE